MKEEYNPGVSASTHQEGSYSTRDLDDHGNKAMASGGIKIRTDWFEMVNIKKIGLFVLSLFLFILAITMMKDGARGLSTLVRDGFSVTNMANSLGFGWLFAYLIMSGSPVAAISLTFFDAGTMDQLSAFSMITGSRLGAGFIVLFIGFLYVLRGRDRGTSLGMGLLALLVTASTYLPGLLIGAFILKTHALDGIQLHSGTLLESIIDRVFNPIVSAISGILPDWGLFLFAIIIILISLNLFDKCLPQMTIKESHVGWMSRLVYKPVVMFALGAAVTMVSMSVSVSLGILVPLSNRGFIRRENVIPYIMGANITTFVDTLLAAVLLNNPSAFTIVFVEMFSITVVSLFILFFLYGPYNRKLLAFTDVVTSSNRNLAYFLAVIFIVPIFLMLI